MRPWQHAAVRAGYSALLSLALPVYALRLWWRGHAEPLYRHAVLERFGFYSSASDASSASGAPAAGWVWVHAVSLGETRAAASLIDSLRTLRPGMRLLLTHGTATGREAGQSLLRDGDAQAWLPYDTAGSTARFFAHFRPVVGVLIETEIWPNLLFAARAASVPVVLANARLSEQSLRKGERFDALLRPALQSLAMVLAQTDDDARRLSVGGANGVVVTGNLKYDLTPDPAQLQAGRAWRDGLRRPVVLAAITREGEEAMLLAAWAGLAAPRPLLIVVPRHPQRFDEVASLVRSSGSTLARRSGWGTAPSAEAMAADVWLGDSMGEMALYYATAHVALLGGSFERLGGHNLIEAAACGCPLIMGPHTYNFDEAARLSIEAGAALRVEGMAQALSRALEILVPEVQAGFSSRAVRFAAQHRGAARRTAEQIATLLNT